MKNEDMGKPLFQLTIGEFTDIVSNIIIAANVGNVTSIRPSEKCQGVRALAEALGCSSTTIYFLLKNGVLADAVISHIGRSYVFDIEKARARANNYKDKNTTVPSTDG